VSVRAGERDRVQRNGQVSAGRLVNHAVHLKPEHEEVLRSKPYEPKQDSSELTLTILVISISTRACCTGVEVRSHHQDEKSKSGTTPR
jgi:hypothetical protein